MRDSTLRLCAKINITTLKEFRIFSHLHPEPTQYATPTQNETDFKKPSQKNL